jgi:hypothetical protein
MGIRSSLLLVAAAVCALATAVFNTAALAATAKPAPVFGAIFTTDQCSNFVNGNVYDTAFTTMLVNDCPPEKGGYPTAPYLDGGPRPNAPCDAAGLPAGDYYFQVTDPSGKVLLSSDPIANRKVNVTGGLIVTYSGSHQNGKGKCSQDFTNISVELFPFVRTPNPGGEYKVWMTKTDYYVSCELNNDPSTLSTLTCQGSFGFIPSTSKTDNFKVADYDGDGIPDAEDACPLDPLNTCVPPPDTCDPATNPNCPGVPA